MPHHITASAEVLVTPGYLAGPTGTAVVAPLLEGAPGWAHTSNGHAPSYASSCQRFCATQHGAWTFTYAADPLAMPVWSAHFDRTTPDEILTAFTHRLIDGAENNFADYLTGGPLHTGQTPARIFADHDWTPIRGSHPWRTLAPDEHAAFHIRTSYIDEPDELREPTAATWTITAGPDPLTRPSWAAHFTAHTPEPLITAAALAVTDPTPVPRPAHRIPHQHRGLLDMHPTARESQAAAAQIRSHTTTQTTRPRTSPTPAPTTTQAATTRSRHRR